MTHRELLILFSGLFIVVLGAAAVLSTVRRYRRELGLKGEDREKTPPVSFIINAFQDVTRQLKEKEKELERLRALAEQRAENVESYTQNILQCVTSGVITFDRNGFSATANRSAEEILGMEPHHILGKTCDDIFGDGHICRLISETLGSGHPSRRMETSLDRRGEHIWLGFNTALLTDRRGAALGVILSFSDLTEVKRLQEQMELKERLTALGEMSAGIAHELRNPMAVISGYLSLLSKKQNSANQGIINSIAAEIDGMNRIIGDLLTFARPASLNRVRVNLKEMLEGCMSTLLQARGREARITAIVSLADVEASLDEVLMRQAFSNLLRNAAEAMPDGGTLSVEAHDGKEAAIVVRDTGVGIPVDKIKKIFLPFFTTKDKGVGMGLALTHKIITSHGGRIDVESREGKGTTFTVTLPKG